MKRIKENPICDPCMGCEDHNEQTGECTSNGGCAPSVPDMAKRKDQCIRCSTDALADEILACMASGQARFDAYEIASQIKTLVASTVTAREYLLVNAMIEAFTGGIGVSGLLSGVEDSKNQEEYEVCLKVEGRYRPVVRAGSLHEAGEKALRAYEEADFGDLEDITCEFVHIVDQDDDYHDYMGGGNWS